MRRWWLFGPKLPEPEPDVEPPPPSIEPELREHRAWRRDQERRLESLRMRAEVIRREYGLDEDRDDADE